MIAEFYGLPGTGKTTTIKKLVESNSKIQWITNGKEIPMKKLVKSACSLEFLCFLFLTSQLMIAKKNHDKTDIPSVRFLRKTYLKYMTLRNNNDKVYCNDHGLIQCVSSLVWQEKKLLVVANKLIRYMTKKNRVGVIMVYVDNDDLDEIWSRICKREDARRIKKMSERDALELLNYQKLLFDSAYKYALQYNVAIRINTHDKLERNVDFLDNKFMELR